MKRSLFLGVLMLTASCGAGTSVGGVGMPLRPMRPEDRVLLGDFSRVNAIATVFDRVYVVYPTALGLYRTLNRHWEVPRAPSEPRLLGSVFAAVVDGIDQSAWLAIPDGWLHYRAEMDQWERGQIPGRVQNVAVDPADPGRGIWFQSSVGWFVQPRFGGIATQATPPKTLRFPHTVEDAMRDMPQLRSLAPTIALGPRLTPGRILNAAPAADGSGWYLGTSSRGLLYFDRMGARGESFGLGLPSDAVGALAANSDGVWVATDATPEMGASLTWLSADLGRSQSVAGLPATGLPFDAARRLLLAGNTLWVGSDKGVLRVSVADGSLKRYDDNNGLADPRVTSLVLRNGKLVVGTLRGLAEETATGLIQRVAPDFFSAVYALAARGDTVWAATASGTAAFLPGASDLRIPDGLRALSGGNPPTYGVGYVSDTLVAMSADRLLWRDPVSGTWTLGPNLSAQLGRLTMMMADDDGVWVAGTRGAALVRPTVGALRVLQIPGDLPDVVTSIARSDRYLWIGTARGLVRYLVDVR
ncbi:MAG: hypothetical protein ABIZ70_09365 [Gemmatimonadales bacterium]